MLFPARIVTLIGDYVGLSDECGAWRATVDILKKEAGETKDGSVVFPEGLIQLIGENEVGHEQAAEVRDSEPATCWYALPSSCSRGASEPRGLPVHRAPRSSSA